MVAGDRVRVINGVGFLYIPFKMGEIVTIKCYHSFLQDEVYLVEYPNAGSWRIDRFELVTSNSLLQCAKDTINMTNDMFSMNRTVPIIRNIKKCECGCSSVGSDRHSSYCPLYQA